MRKNSILLLIIIAVASTNLFGLNSNAVPLDGYNGYSVDISKFLFNSNLGITTGTENDSFYFIKMPQNADDSLKKQPVVSFSGFLGAENGDALFNQYSKPDAYINRDHETGFSLIGTVPKIPLLLAYKYRYVDTYSDRFDELWSDFGNIVSRPMQYSAEGLSKEHYAVARYQSDNLQLQISYNNYGHWGATPFYFSPIYSKGFTLSPHLQFSKNDVIFSTDFNLNNYSIYYDHRNPEDFNDFSSFNSIQLPLSSQLKSILSINYNYALDPEASFSLGIINTGSRFHWGLTGTFFSDNNLGINGFGNYSVSSHVNCSLSVSRDHLPAERSFTFWENNRAVKYSTITTDQTNLYGAVTYTDTLHNFPFHMTFWYQYCSDPIWESVSYNDDSTFINQMVIKKSAQSIIGLCKTYNLKYKSFKINVIPGINFPLDDSLVRFRIAKQADFEILYSNSQSNPVTLSMLIKYRDKAILNYPINGNTNDMKTYSTPANTSANLHLRLPLTVPFLNSTIKNTAFVADFGPVRFSKEQRILEHPRGNYIGPAIYAGFEGILR